MMSIQDILLPDTQEAHLSTFSNVDKPLSNATVYIIISQALRFAIEAFGMVPFEGIAYLLFDVMGKEAYALPILGALALGAQRMLPLLEQTYLSYSQL